MKLHIVIFAFIFIILNFERNPNFFVSCHSPLYASNKLKTPGGHSISKWDRIQILKSLPAGIDKLLTNFDESLSRCGKGQSFDIRELTIDQAQKFFTSGELSSEELTKCYLKRIQAMNKYLKAMIEINPDAVKIAKEADAERKTMSNRSALHGIPILIKDNLGTADKMQTTVGAIALQWVLPKSDSDVVKKLRAAGAVILGKTNPSEWAYFRGSDIPSGWSGLGGQTLNPYNLTADPSGSSSGSGVGTAANFGLVSIGTETDGSIISPSSVGSLVGLKPTLGCVSTQGVVPLSFSQDVVGPMTRTVRDAVLLFNVIAEDKCKIRLNFKIFYDEEKTDKLKIGVLRNPYWNISDAFLAQHIPKLEIALRHLHNSRRAIVIDPVVGNSEVLKKVTGKNEMIVFTHEFKYSLNEYLENLVKHLEVHHGRKRMSHLSDIIQFNKEKPPPEGYNQDTLIRSEATDGLQNVTYKTVHRQNRHFAQEFINAILDGSGPNGHGKLDAIATPCYADDTRLFYSVGAIAGYPQITIPAGIADNGVPIGICFGGRPNSEATLLKIGYILEKVYFQRSKPKFILA